jgi:predicted O-methyltransferase YrrM
MSSSLQSKQVADVLDRLFAEAEENDQVVIKRARKEATRQGLAPNDPAMTELLGEAYIAVDRPGGRLLYALVRSRAARLVVEFGTSFGISTLYLAAAVRDNGEGRVVTSELHAGKVRQARANLEAAGLLDLVDVREGDALQTLHALDAPIDLLFLDGWKELYLPVLQLLEPQLRPGSVVVADDVSLYPDALSAYVAYVRNPAHGYESLEIPIGYGLELSVRSA